MLIQLHTTEHLTKNKNRRKKINFNSVNFVQVSDNKNVVINKKKTRKDQVLNRKLLFYGRHKKFEGKVTPNDYKCI